MLSRHGAADRLRLSRKVALFKKGLTLGNDTALVVLHTDVVLREL